MKNKKRVLVIGGGVGGTMTANNLVNKLYPEICRDEVNVMMISNTEIHKYKLANMYVAFNSFYPYQVASQINNSVLKINSGFSVYTART